MDQINAGRDSRAAIADILRTTDAALTIEDISAQTGLHANTVRSHLDVLLASGEVDREVLALDAAKHKGRGRPRWAYRFAAQVASPYQILAAALSSQLGQIRDPAAAKGAASLWVDALPHLPVAATPDEAVDEAVQALIRLGFQAEATPLGDAIHISQCPYSDIVDDNPVICDIHTAMLSTILEHTGQPIGVASMEVWSRPDLCTARLRRADQRPSRVITLKESS